MELLRWKARLSALWVFVAVSTSAMMFLSFMMPGAIEEIMAGKMAGEPLCEGMMVAYAFYWLIPLIMAVLCLTLNGSANRWLNFVLGIIWGLWFIAGIFEHVVMADESSVAILLMFIAVIVASAFIAWFAWKLPQVEA
jgi:hypothetical protein